jgi:two-component system OmpR family response regulator
MEKKKILLVDDNPDITRTLSKILEATGKYIVREENTSLQTLATARDFKPDLVFLDFMMPDFEGNEVAAQIEADDELKHIKIVFLTAIVTKEEVESGRVNNISGYTVLAKPVKTQELISCIEDLLGA